MPYPIIMQGSAVAPGESFSVTFRPLAAGLINATVKAVGLQPSQNGGGGNGGGGGHPPPRRPVSFRVGLKLEIFKPGTANAVASSIGGPVTVPPASNRLVAWADTPAAATDLAADWIARVTNTGSSPANYIVTVRYQVVPGNLGKIDHVVVLMMENRSFDHMLGYLRLLANRTDVDGLTGTESNNDDSGNPVAVHPLATDGRQRPTYFANDPGHGWDDVSEQLGGALVIHPTPMEGPTTSPRAGDAVEPRVVPPPGPHNDGFVRNFAKQLASAAQSLPPQTGSVHDEGEVAGGDTRFVHFRPAAPGPVSGFCKPKNPPSHSETGFLAELVLRRPGSNAPLRDVKAKIGDRSFGTSYPATAADLAAAGDWTFEVRNWTETPVTFSTDASFVVAEHDTRGQEPAGAIMGFYDAGQLPIYNMFASEFAICNRWFAALPTDTWPNRLYSLTGGSGGMITTPSTSSVPSDPPGYTLTTIFEVLQAHGIDWMNYFSDLPFALIFKRLAQDSTYTRRMRSLADFLAAAHSGDLPSVAWLDPNFTDVETSLGEPVNANDDHPPGDVAHGQALVQQIYQALSQGPGWSKTLLIVTYDEHGGFYDHVLPPGTPTAFGTAAGGPPDDIPNLRRYGVRVPAFIVSPWVQRGFVANDTYDHTSLIATVLRRFCATPIPGMGARADNALDVGSLLSLDVPHPPASAPAVSPPVPGPPSPMLSTTFGAVLRKSLFGF